MKIEAAKLIKVMAIAVGDRYLAPEPAAIEQMAKSLKDVGQLTPITVRPITTKTYRVVAGATRFKAASQLGWDKIRAEVAYGSDVDCRIHELGENLERRNLTSAQRRKIKADYKALLEDAAAKAEPSKGGRGKKGGLSQAARDVGASRRAVQREHNKPAQNTSSAQVSAPASQPKDAHVPPSMSGSGSTKLAMTWSVGEDARFNRYRKTTDLDRSHCLRRIANDFLDGWEKEQVNG